MINQNIAAILYKMSEILEIKGAKWVAIAYNKAARNIESLSEDISKIYEKGGIKALKEIPGVGKGVAKKIIEFIKTGKIKKYTELKKSIPIDIESLTRIEGLGPKKISLLYKELKIKNLKDLQKAAKDGLIRKLPGMREKTEKNILTAIKFTKSINNRKLLGHALPIAREIKELLKKQEFTNKVEIAGSLARRKETIGDIDILITSSNPKKVMDFFTSMPKVKRIIAKGNTKSTIIYEDMNVDARVLPSNQFGSAIQYFVGSKEHNVAIRRIAMKKGYKLSEYGLFKNKKEIAGKDEKEIYKKLGMQWPPYEIRENSGEIEAALNKKLPNLIKQKDIQGDLHMHSTFSDGKNTILEMANACKTMGYKYCAITNHSTPMGIANPLSPKDIKKQKIEIEKINKKMSGFTILHGTEVDIKLNGDLILDNKTLKGFDIVIASIHQGMRRNKEQQTKRIIKAIENKYVNIIAHPTGRLINERIGYEVDIDKIINAAKANNVALEINSYPSRLDLNDLNARKAIKKGVMLEIGTDAHTSDQLNFMEYGVATARRAWCKKNDIINTFSLTKLLQRIKK